MEIGYGKAPELGVQGDGLSKIKEALQLVVELRRQQKVISIANRLRDANLPEGMVVLSDFGSISIKRSEHGLALEITSSVMLDADTDTETKLYAGWDEDSDQLWDLDARRTTFSHWTQTEPLVWSLHQDSGQANTLPFAEVVSEFKAVEKALLTSRWHS